MTTFRRILMYCLSVGLVTGGLALQAPSSSAQVIPNKDFSLEVSPSPLAATIKPGTKTTLELKIRNAGTKPETLRIESRSFRIAYPDQNILISNTTPPDLAKWVHFSEPTFTVAPGTWHTESVTIALPEQAGFSYPFVVVVSRADEQAVESGGRLLKGSIAVFALINIDRPGSTRSVVIESFTTSRRIYEYLPTTLSLKLKNTGNSIVQPYGNIYLQRNSNDIDPLSVLPVNEARGYILPGNTKEITAQWQDGFPAYYSLGKSGEKPILKWNTQSTDKFRIGRYTAKVVAVYNDGTRDVPITGEVTFWVIPWKILLGLVALLVLIGVGIWSTLRRIGRRVSKFGKPSTH